MLLGVQNAQFVQSASKTWIERSNLFSLFDRSIKEILCLAVLSSLNSGLSLCLVVLPEHAGPVAPPSGLLPQG
jgi:hypothetical protein